MAESAQTSGQIGEEKNDFLVFPTNMILGVIDDDARLEKTLDALRNAGISNDDIHTYRGRRGENELDFTGESHGILATLIRTAQHYSAERHYLEVFKSDLESGSTLLMVRYHGDENRNRIADILFDSQARRITRFGLWTIEELRPRTAAEGLHHYGYRRLLDLPFDDVVEKTRAALAAEGFGILTEIDLAGKFNEKLGVDHEPYLIIEACDPRVAFPALQEESDLGLLLPCNVVVYRKEGKTVVSAIDAERMLSITENPALAESASEVNARLQRALKSIA
jgi:uncharacterized protein (DUF302 family)